MKEKFRHRSGLPRVGWMLTGTTDNYTATFACENCGFPHVRFVHELLHERSSR
jgi:hypothetical protein